MNISTAVGSERVSRIVGYKLKKGFFQTSSPNLPQRIYLLGQGNAANQATMPVVAREVTSAKEAGTLYGYGSPIHQMMRILRPVSGDGIGGIPTVVFAQPDAEGATQTVITADLTLSATATDSATHYVVINGRYGLDGAEYGYSVVKGDAKATIVQRIADACNNVMSCPAIVSVNGEGQLVFTSKWAGATAAEMVVTFDDQEKDCGIVYSIEETIAGTGAVDLTDAIAGMGSSWNTVVLNPYGSTVFTTLETVNGIPDPDNPTGRYGALIFKPFISIWGSCEDDKTTLGAITDARKTQVTHAIAPAPNSSGFTWEAAANMTYLFVLQAQNNPHLDVNAKAYPDMPVPSDGVIGDMSDYNNRDYLVKKGCSTVDLVAGSYVVQDFVTTYHPDGELPPQYRYPRNLMLDFNVRYGYYLLELINVVDKTLAPSDQSINVASTIKPKDWKQVLRSYADDLAGRALIADASFMKDSIVVQVSTVNPDRLETYFRYKRTGIARIASTDAEAGFAFGIV
jgi:phage tail sheath gpL-like